jgi:hypothetical protein
MIDLGPTVERFHRLLRVMITIDPASGFSIARFGSVPTPWEVIMRPWSFTSRVLMPVLLLLGALVLAVPALGHEGPHGPTAVVHGPVTTNLTTPGSDGHQLGDTRVTSIEVADDSGAVIGRIDATLITTAVDVPNDGDEIRISELVFSFGDGADQFVIGGTGVYPAAGSTIAVSTSVTRPVLGGVGIYAGVEGSVTSEHLADGTWRHSFNLSHDPTEAGSTPAPAPSAEAGIIRTSLGATLPATAPGQALGLWHYTIPVGKALTPHTHPGYQVARVETGVLSYTVISGSVRVLRGDGTTETGEAGAVLTIYAGDTVIENPDLAHFGANEGSVPVEIAAASLFTEGSEPALPLASPGG